MCTIACCSERRGFRLVNRNLWCPTRFFIGTIILHSLHSSIALCADDSKMYRIISTQEDLSTSQSDIDKISDWCKMNKMIINTKKCKVMRITRKKSPLVGEYNIEGQPLESVNVYKDLGTNT